MKARRQWSSMLVFACAGCAGCDWGTTSRDDFERQYPCARTTVFDPSTLGRALAALERQIGGDDSLRVRTVDLRRDEVRVQAPDPRNAHHMNGYWWDDGELHEPVPMPTLLVQWSDADFFSVRELPRDVRPFVKTGFAAANVEDGHVTGLNIQRGHDGNLVLRVSSEGPRGSASVDVGLAGNVVDVHRH